MNGLIMNIYSRMRRRMGKITRVVQLVQIKPSIFSLFSLILCLFGFTSAGQALLTSRCL